MEDGGDDKEGDEREEEIYEEYLTARARREKLRSQLASASAARQARVEEERRRRQLLVQEKAELLKAQRDGPPVDTEEIRKREEMKLMEAFETFKPLVSAAEHAHDIQYADSMQTSWRPPRVFRQMKQDRMAELRRTHFIDYVGEDQIAPILRFEDMKLPRCIVEHMRSRGVRTPTPIQIQGFPVVLSGRDMIGIAFTGTGKTLVFVVPALLFALEQELKLELTAGEGPFSLIVCPSRELAVQTLEVCEEYADALYRKGGFPRLRLLLMIGGTPVYEQSQVLRRGVHVVVCTPGRAIDMLTKERMLLEQCRLLVLDEADRLVDDTFEEDVRTIISHFRHQRQTCLFSATMPVKVQNFVKSALVRPVIVNVGRAGAANLDVVQDVEYVQSEKKIVYLLEALRKTPPPVLLFAEGKGEVDDIYEYLLVKGVRVTAIHGGKDQEERMHAVSDFKSGKKDVLVATDVASKGLDFPNVQHVINFGMPKEIENYVHRIGRTGRCGRTGLATTFVNRTQSSSILLDLKQVLLEARQKVPPFLEMLVDSTDAELEVGGVRGCAYCGGLGHRITDCPKLEEKTKSAAAGTSRYLRDEGY